MLFDFSLTHIPYLHWVITACVCILIKTYQVTMEGIVNHTVQLYVLS